MLEAAGQPEPRESPRVRALCERYVGFLARELERPTTRTTVMPGVHALLERLEAEPGVVLGLLTGNVAQGAALKLRSGGIAPERFRVGAYGSDAAHRPDLPPIAARRAEAIFGRVPRGAEVVIIGDTPADVACGAGIEARALGGGHRRVLGRATSKLAGRTRCSRISARRTRCWRRFWRVTEIKMTFLALLLVRHVADELELKAVIPDPDAPARAPPGVGRTRALPRPHDRPAVRPRRRARRARRGAPGAELPLR